MIEWIQNFIRNYSNGMYFPHIQIKDIIEILIVTIIVYEIMLWIKNTKAWMLLRGMLMLGGFILLAWLFQMNTILYLARESINVLAIAAIVVFQPELRRALEKLGEKNLFSNINPFDKNKENQRFSDETLDSIVRACYAMGSVCTGALIVVEQVGNRQAGQPAGLFQFRLVVEMADVADAQVGDGHDLGRHAERLLQFRLVEDAHPADTQPLGAGGQPQVLHGAHAAIQIHRLDVRTADDDRAGAFAVTGNAQVDRRLDDAFQLELAVRVALAFREHHRRFGMGLGKGVMHPLLDLRRADDQEVPRLHETDRWGMVGGEHDAGEHLVRHRVGQELAAHVTAVEDGAIDGGALGVGKGVVDLVFHEFPLWKNDGCLSKQPGFVSRPVF